MALLYFLHTITFKTVTTSNFELSDLYFEKVESIDYEHLH